MMKGTIFYIFLGIVAGIFIIGSSPAIAFTLFAGATLLTFFAFKPKIGILALVVLISSIVFEEAIPIISIGIGSLHITDILLLFLFGTMFFKLSSDKTFRFIRTPLDIPLISFYFAVIISAFIAIYVYRIDFNIVMRQFRCLTYYLVFFLITNLIRDWVDVKFIIKGLFTISFAVSIAMILQAILGESIHLMPGRVEATETFGRIYGATRILPPGQTLILVMFITCVCCIVFMDKQAVRSRYYYLLPVMGAALILTYNRNYWASIIFSLIIFTLLVSKKYKKRIIAWSLIMFIVTSLVIILFLGIGGKPREFAVSTLDRVVSLFNGEKLFYSDSLEWRKMENYHATRVILTHPVVGIGLGNSYRSQISGSADKLTDYTHNGYLWILWNMGLMGFIPFLWLCAVFLYRGFLNWRYAEDNFLKAAMIGFTLSYTGIMAACLVNPMFSQWFSIIVIGIIMGINEVIIRINIIEKNM